MDWRVLALAICVFGAIVSLLTVRNKTLVGSWHSNQVTLLTAAIALVAIAITIGLNLHEEQSPPIRPSTGSLDSLQPTDATASPTSAVPSQSNVPSTRAPDSDSIPTGSVSSPDATTNREAINAAAFGAAKVRDWDQVEKLLERGADVNAQDTDGKTLLIWSIAWPDSNNGTDLAAPKMLIQHGANINYRMPNCVPCARPALGVPTVAGFTPLHYAAWSGDKPLAALLVEAGAHLEIQDDAGRPPLYAAIDLGQYDVAQYLIEHGASVPNTIQVANQFSNDDVKRWLTADGFPAN